MICMVAMDGVTSKIESSANRQCIWGIETWRAWGHLQSKIYYSNCCMISWYGLIDSYTSSNFPQKKFPRIRFDLVEISSRNQQNRSISQHRPRTSILTPWKISYINYPWTTLPTWILLCTREQCLYLGDRLNCISHSCLCILWFSWRG